MQHLSDLVSQIVLDLFGQTVIPEMTRPEEQFGDFATNVALQLSKLLKMPPRAIAEQISAELAKRGSDSIREVSVAGPGFINIFASDSWLITAANTSTAKPKIYENKVIVAEYSDPNAFKQLHVGHLYTTLVGDVIARLYEVTGAQVHRVNFGGDVGLHVAKNMWAIMQALEGENPDGLSVAGDNADAQAAWLNARYIEGNHAYESDPEAKQAIVDINQRVYAVHAAGDRESNFAKIYWTCRQWSYDYFEAFYNELQVSPFEKYYPESQTAAEGLATVKHQLEQGTYQNSDNAVVFNGEPYGLHTRVFINSNGLPTYEAKDVGLIMAKWRDYHFDESIVITGNDIIEYMKVVLKSIEQFEPELAKRTLHLTHGNIRLQGGVKMSSRLGNGVMANDVLTAARQANKAANDTDDEAAVLGAVKYAFLRQRIGSDIIYDPSESVSIHGNSGPYLQYAHARARSILAKGSATAVPPVALDSGERSLARKISEYPDIVGRAAREHLPHHICTYLYELAQSFNHFYEHNRVNDDPRAAERTQLVGWYAAVLKDGLDILGIHAPERM